MENKIDLSNYSHSFSFKNKIGRLLWNCTYWFLFRPYGLFIFNSWRNFVLKMFGAKVGKGTIIHASVKIWAPWNLVVGEYTCLGQNVDCYNQGEIIIGDNTTISQKSYLCASTHDITDPKNNLILKPIHINNQVWVAANSFIGPGVTIGEGAVVGATSSVFKNVKDWTVVGGNPSVFLKERIING
ncbi:putative colanic acid biosynthesis acetyltransferase [Lutibacter holmesii]|uniref:Colanic acid biosynthesis acetyltransferase n=1 Tax=Lutibacter holmesii TaxID=1137985 RepID=A0ABW3WP97_9FLAO